MERPHSKTGGSRSLSISPLSLGPLSSDTDSDDSDWEAVPELPDVGMDGRDASGVHSSDILGIVPRARYETSLQPACKFIAKTRK